MTSKDAPPVDEAHLWADFQAICECGGRLSGTESERRVLALVEERAREATGVAGTSLAVPYEGWSARAAELVLPGGQVVACHPLVRTVSTPDEGVAAEVVDLGRGTPEEFEAHAGDLSGRFALVRHELMFAAGTIHRRRKYEMAREAGAIGFLIAGPLSGSPVAGSTGRAGGAGIPAAGIPPEAAAQLRRTSRGWPEARLRIVAEEAPAQTRTLIFDMPGRTEDYIVLCAHVDGHDLAESAMDNATGVAAALAVARALRGEVGGLRRGLRVAFFSVEEWALTGSARYVEALTEAERDRIALNVNLDSIAGSANLTALTSGFPALEPFLLAVAEASGQPLRTVRPLMTNSDHANFALAGIPAFRLVAGYDEPGANLRLVLTNQDTRDKVIETDLLRATELTAMIVAAACDAPAEVAARWRRRSTNAT